MIIAVDFDGTVVEHEYPKIGKPIPFAIETLKKLQEDGHTLLMWTVREDEYLKDAINYVESKGLKYHAYNKNYSEEDVATAARKLNADIFIDDRNVGGLPDWGLIYRSIKAAEKGIMSFDYAMLAEGNGEQYKSYRKKNFLIRLGEMFENNKY